PRRSRPRRPCRPRRRPAGAPRPGGRRRAMRARAASTFASIRQSHNFRLYMAGQTVSMAGTWMQQVAQGWLVLQLTNSGTMLGFITAAQFVPVLFLGPFGGVVVDRVDTRRLLAMTQFAAGVLAGVL